MSKILYFLAGAPGIPPTSAETAEIAVINALAAQQYEVHVMCGGSRASITGINLSAVASDNSYNDAGSTVTGTGISAAAADNSLNDSNNGFVTAGFKVGDVLTISGFTGDTDNNTTGIAVAESVAAGKIVVSGVTLVNDDAGETVTISTGGRFLQRGFAKGMNVMVRGFTTTANNISTGIITDLTATKMTIGGTDGDGIANEIAGDAVTICSVETGILAGDAVIAADYIAGTVPEQYKSSGTPIYTVFDPTTPPESPGLATTQAIISHGETVAVKNSAGSATDNATATVAAHACTVALPATKTVVENGDATTLSSKAISVAVGSGVLGVATFTNATDCAVSNGGTVAVVNSAGTATDNATAAVSGNAIANVALPATKTVVETGDTVAVDGKTATLTVTAGALASGALVATQQVVAHGDTVAVINSADTATDNATAVITTKDLELQLPATKTVVENADTVSVDGVSVPLVVSAGALASTTLISSGSTSKVITSGIEIPASGVITSKVTVTIVDGVITACVGG